MLNYSFIVSSLQVISLQPKQTTLKENDICSTFVGRSSFFAFVFLDNGVLRLSS